MAYIPVLSGDANYSGRYVTGKDIADVLTAVGVILTAVASMWGLFLTRKNARTLEDVKHNTNGLVAHNEKMARQVGEVVGEARGKAQAEAAKP